MTLRAGRAPCADADRKQATLSPNFWSAAATVPIDDTEAVALISRAGRQPRRRNKPPDVQAF